jgi:hypothetical protein
MVKKQRSRGYRSCPPRLGQPARTLFSRLTRRRLKRGVFRSIVELQTAINRFIAETNADPKPVVWTAQPDRAIASVRRGSKC